MLTAFTWLDHDSQARDRSIRLLALFDERSTRDELGLGSIRDRIADRLFPGTSTIQTRLRYMLFVPWIYQELERKVMEGQLLLEEFRPSAASMEYDLVTALLNSDDRVGVFGRMAGRKLKRLPSSVYWAGLGSWGIRRTDLPQHEYHRRIDRICEKRRQARARVRDQRVHGDDGGQIAPSEVITWHPRIPEPPKVFPGVADLRLTYDEAVFLQDRILAEHSDSLLAHLASAVRSADVDAPWEHPDMAGFRVEHRVILDHARRFSKVMYGAALLYNLFLAELKGQEDIARDRRVDFERWEQTLDINETASWQLSELWNVVGWDIAPPTRRFVARWIDLVLTGADELPRRADARELIENRERSLKRSRSRFTNHRSLENWGGASMLDPLNYRWGTTKRLLQDLYEGLTSNGRADV